MEHDKTLPSLIHSLSKSYKTNAYCLKKSHMYTLEASSGAKTKLKNFVKAKNRFGAFSRASLTTSKHYYGSFNDKKEIESKNEHANSSYILMTKQEVEKVEYLKRLEMRLLERKEMIQNLERDNDSMQIELIKQARKKSLNRKASRQDITYDSQWITKISIEDKRVPNNTNIHKKTLKLNNTFIMQVIL